MLRAENITLSYHGISVIKQVSLEIPEHKITVLLGANGCGKSTLLKSLAGLLPPQSGSILLNGKNIYREAPKKNATRIAMLAQNTASTEEISVNQLVRYGRYPYHNLFSRWSEEDERQVQTAMRLTGTESLSENMLESLSGGQRQRAWIAMTLAQNTPCLLLDEPTTYLDLTYQIEILDLLKKLNTDECKTIVMVLHDLNLAARYADHIIALKNGVIYTQGTPQQVLTEANIQNVFGLTSKVISDPLYQTPLCIPVSSYSELK